MITHQIALRSARDVQDFINAATTFNGDIRLSHDGRQIDGKSIMGIFSLNLSENLTMLLSNASENDITSFLANLKQFIIC